MLLGRSEAFRLLPFSLASRFTLFVVPKLNHRSPFHHRWSWIFLSAAYAAVFLVILVFAYQGKLPGFLTQNDKLAHVILYAIATFLGHRVLNRRRISIATYAMPLFPTLFSLFTIVEELVQSFSPNRSLDAWDLVASLVGVALEYGFAELGHPKPRA